MSESFAMGESSPQGMRDTGSRTGETVFRYPATRVIPPGRHDFHLGIDRGERRLDWRTKCLHPSTNGRRRGNIMALDLHRMRRSEEHTSELQSLMRISYADFCLKKKK